jgi:hypothetical protein
MLSMFLNIAGQALTLNVPQVELESNGHNPETTTAVVKTTLPLRSAHKRVFTALRHRRHGKTLHMWLFKSCQNLKGEKKSQ